MRMRWVGSMGILLVLTALVVGTVGTWLVPTAVWGKAWPDASGHGMMGSTSGSMMGGTSGGMMGDTNAATLPYDLRFLNNMTMHHQMAVMSSQMMIADSPRPQLRDLAKRIIAGQQAQIAQMARERHDWYSPANGADAQPSMMGQMMSSGMMNGGPMRQMMGSTTDVDRMFLQMMIPHHQAAIDMAQDALKNGQHPELKDLAQAIIKTQSAEITEMQGYLHEWYGAASS